MIEVSKEEFFRIIGPMNVHPRSEPECSIWENLNTRAVIGRSEPGFRSPTGKQSRYWVDEKYGSLAASQQQEG